MKRFILKILKRCKIMKTVACIIARTNSKRLPQKVLKKIKNKSMIEYIIYSVKKVKGIDSIYVCTSNLEEDRILKDVAEKNNVKFYAGSETAVIERMLDVAEVEKADNIIRITGDNIFTDSDYLEKMVEGHIKNGVDYTRTEYLSIGVTAEVMKVNALRDCYKNIDPDKSEYLFLYMFNPEKYKCLVLVPSEKYKCPYSTLTVDTEKDWERTKIIIENLDEDYSYKKIIELSSKLEIPNFFIENDINIKLPDDKVISYKKFREELEIKILKSKILNI